MPEAKSQKPKASSSHCHLYTDGGARGNPGPAAGGAVLKSPEGEVVDTCSKYLGETTNNQAEYIALIIGLEMALENGCTDLAVFMDSELAIKQINGEYKVKNSEIAKRFLEVHNLRLKFKKLTFTHVRREKNTEADALVNKCIDEEVC